MEKIIIWIKKNIKIFRNVLDRNVAILLTLKQSAKRKVYRTSGVESIGYNLHSKNTR